MQSLVALFNSRKFWTGTITILGIAVALVLRAKGLVDKDEFVPTILAVTGVGVSVIAGISWEDGKAKEAKPAAVDVTQNISPSISGGDPAKVAAAVRDTFAKLDPPSGGS